LAAITAGPTAGAPADAPKAPPQPDESDIAVHQQLCELNEALLYLALDPSGLVGGGGGTGDLPIGIFESEVVLVGETPTPRFARLGYKDSHRVGSAPPRC